MYATGLPHYTVLCPRTDVSPRGLRWPGRVARRNYTLHSCDKRGTSAYDAQNVHLSAFAPRRSGAVNAVMNINGQPDTVFRWTRETKLNTRRPRRFSPGPDESERYEARYSRYNCTVVSVDFRLSAHDRHVKTTSCETHVHFEQGVWFGSKIENGVYVLQASRKPEFLPEERFGHTVSCGVDGIAKIALFVQI